jgi:hypothetical protein
MVIDQKQFPIAAECGIYLRPNGHGDDRRFAGLFARVWRRIPDLEREQILSQWRRWVTVGDDGRLEVSIALENWSGLRRQQAIGDCEYPGTILKFYGRVVDILPEELVMYVIAHELAHVVQYFHGKTLRPDPHPLGEAVAYVNSSVEREADEIALRWGFSGKQFDKWMAKNVNWLSFPPDPY